MNPSVNPDNSPNDATAPDSQPADTQPPDAQPHPSPSPSVESLPMDYEILVEVRAVVSVPPSASSSDPPVSHPEHSLRIVQGPLTEAKPYPDAPTDSSYHAFISTADINIPLFPTTVASPIAGSHPPAFRITIRSGTYIITLNPKTEPELVEGFEKVLKWFCRWTPAETTPLPAIPPADDPFAKIGDAGVRFVENLGTSINTKLQTRLSTRKEEAQNERSMNVKLGGKVTSAVLGGTRKVVGKGASVASSATEKISEIVANGISKNPVSRSLSEAPEGSVKKRFHNNLMSGLLAFGRIYVAADTQGKIILEATGDNVSDLARMKYGPEAENASRKVAGIAVDGYRIARFPRKLGATSIVKGAFKSSFGRSYDEDEYRKSLAASPETFASEPDKVDQKHAS